MSETRFFNLLDERWIPILRKNGRADRVGIREALREAGTIRQIAASNPMDNLAILRFLLAVLYWCKNKPPTLEEKAQLVSAVGFSSVWVEKLQDNSEFFNLLGNGKRFYQNEAYKHHPPAHTINYLIQEVPSGTNKTHFRHSLDLVDGLCPACCAMGLVRLPVFSTSGGKGMSASTGKSYGINAKPPLYFVPIGNSLLETLLLSWREYDGELGTPAWESSIERLPQDGKVSLLTGLTWLPRTVWLADPQEPARPCISCGRSDQLIRKCVFDGKGSSRTDNRIWRDPHVIYAVKDDRAVQTSNALGASDAAVSHWVNRTAAVLQARESIQAQSTWLVGFSTVDNDKYLEAVDYLFPIQEQSLSEEAFIKALEQYHKAWFALVKRFTPSSKNRKVRKKRHPQPFLESIRPEVELRISERLRTASPSDQLFATIGAEEYRPMMHAVANAVSPGFTVAAVRRRHDIANAVPVLVAKPPAKAAKAKRTKGGKK